MAPVEHVHGNELGAPPRLNDFRLGGDNPSGYRGDKIRVVINTHNHFPIAGGDPHDRPHSFRDRAAHPAVDYASDLQMLLGHMQFGHNVFPIRLGEPQPELITESAGKIIETG